MDSYPGDFPFGIMDVVELLHLRIRRRQANSVYVDCPFCGDRRGKMNVNFVKNVWRCNYCDEHGGMLALYARLNNTTTSDAYWEIGEALCNDFHRERPNSGYEMAGNQQAGTGSPVSGTQTDLAGYERRGERKTVQQAERASGQDIHQTLRCCSLCCLFSLPTATICTPQNGDCRMNRSTGLGSRALHPLSFAAPLPSG